MRGAESRLSVLPHEGTGTRGVGMSGWTGPPACSGQLSPPPTLVWGGGWVLPGRPQPRMRMSPLSCSVAPDLQRTSDTNSQLSHTQRFRGCRDTESSCGQVQLTCLTLLCTCARNKLLATVHSCRWEGRAWSDSHVIAEVQATKTLPWRRVLCF